MSEGWYQNLMTRDAAGEDVSGDTSRVGKCNLTFSTPAQQAEKIMVWDIWPSPTTEKASP